MKARKCPECKTALKAAKYVVEFAEEVTYVSIGNKDIVDTQVFFCPNCGYKVKRTTKEEVI